MVCGGFGKTFGSGCMGLREGSVSKMLNFPCLAVHGFGIGLSFTAKGFGHPSLVCVTKCGGGGGLLNAAGDVNSGFCALATSIE